MARKKQRDKNRHLEWRWRLTGPWLQTQSALLGGWNNTPMGSTALLVCQGYLAEPPLRVKGNGYERAMAHGASSVRHCGRFRFAGSGECVAGLAIPFVTYPGMQCSLTRFLERGLQSASASKPAKTDQLTCGIANGEAA